MSEPEGETKFADMSSVPWHQRTNDWAIQASGLVKRYSGRTVLNGLNLHVPRGGVHGLLGPNGSGKTTSIRILLGLVRANGGEAKILGETVPKGLTRVIDEVGAIVESPKFSPRMSGRHNLNVLADSIGAPPRRVSEVLLEVGLAADAERHFQQYSLGMKQRLAIAATLLKRPSVLIFDEPTNGLDPVGIHDIRTTMRGLADAGRTVLVSSHILSEIEQIADSVSIIAGGKVVAEGSMQDFLSDGAPHVRVRIERALEATDLLRAAGWRVDVDETGLRVSGRNGQLPDAAVIAETLGMANLWPQELTTRRVSLEQVFLQLTSDVDLGASQSRRRWAS